MASKELWIDLTTLTVHAEKPSDADLSAQGRDPQAVVVRDVTTTSGDGVLDWFGGIQGMIDSRMGAAAAAAVAVGVPQKDTLVKLTIEDPSDVGGASSVPA